MGRRVQFPAGSGCHRQVTGWGSLPAAADHAAIGAGVSLAMPGCDSHGWTRSPGLEIDYQASCPEIFSKNNKKFSPLLTASAHSVNMSGMKCLVCGISNSMRPVYLTMDQRCSPCVAWEFNYIDVLNGAERTGRWLETKKGSKYFPTKRPMRLAVK